MSSSSSSCLLLLILAVGYSAASDSEAKEYLERFGYITSNSDNASSLTTNQLFTDGLKEFQSAYQLPITGTLSPETISLMKTPRCGVADYQIRSHWNKSNTETVHLFWNFNRGTQEDVNIASLAFSAWEKVANLKFSRKWTSAEANIIISYGSSYSHNMVLEQKQCKFNLNSVVLGHAFYPDPSRSQLEMHLYLDMPWYKKDIYSPPSGMLSLYNVLLHEIGHALGIAHSLNKDAVMYSYYHEAKNRSLQLHQDDIDAVHEIYGKKPTPTTTTTSTTTSRPSATTTTSRPPPPDLCTIRNINQFVIIDDIMYALYEGYLWAINLKTNVYEPPVLLRDWFTFLPENSKIQSVHQDANGDIIAVINNQIYVIDSQSLQLRPSYPMPMVRLIPANAQFNTMFATYTGKTYVLFDDVHVKELSFYHNARYFIPGKQSRLSQVFPSLPAGVESSFRYINGLMYFFKNGSLFEYNQFTKSLVRTISPSLDIFNIECPTKMLLSQLKSVLSDLSNILTRSIDC